MSRRFSFFRAKTAKNSRLKLLLLVPPPFLFPLSSFSFVYSHPSYVFFGIFHNFLFFEIIFSSLLFIFFLFPSFWQFSLCLPFFGFNYSDSGLTLFFVFVFLAVLLIMFNKAVLSSYNFPYANVITLFQVPSLLSCSDGLSYTFLSYGCFSPFLRN